MTREDGNIVIRGWGCTPTGDAPAAAISSDQPTKRTCLPAIFTRGWRRNVLYSILLCLMLLIFLNIALTLWVISALRLNKDGVGPIKIVKGGIQLEGQAWVVDNMVASTIMSQVGQPIALHSQRNFSIIVTDSESLEQSRLLIKRGNMEFTGHMISVRDARGSVFQASREEVRVHADTLTVEGVGGVTVGTAVQAPLVRAPPGADLQLESLTRKLDLRAPQSIFIESRAGGIDITSHTDIKLDSVVGAIKIDAPNIIINNLKEAKGTEHAQKLLRKQKVYQLCACATGKLFLAPPEVPCSADSEDTELCR